MRPLDADNRRADVEALDRLVERLPVQLPVGEQGHGHCLHGRPHGAERLAGDFIQVIDLTLDGVIRPRHACAKHRLNGSVPVAALSSLEGVHEGAVVAGHDGKADFLVKLSRPSSCKEVLSREAGVGPTSVNVGTPIHSA